jgi:peroxiredoxin Q/BCP
MRLRPGQMAPIFSEVDLYGRRVSLMDYANVRVMLSFFRAAVCPLCNLRLAQLIQRYPLYHREGLYVIAFFESSPEYGHHYLDRQQAPFPLIASLGSEVYDQYGLGSSFLASIYARLTRWSQYRGAARLGVGGNPLQNVYQMDGRFGRLPADVLLDPGLIVRRAYYARDPGDFMLFSEVDAFLASPISAY